MNFVSFAFLVLLMFVLLARLVFGREKVEPLFVWALIAATIVFCAWHVPAYLLVMLYVIAANYWMAIWISRRPPDSRARRRLLWLSVLSNVGVLVFFKYADFLTGLAADGMRLLGIAWTPARLDLILPIGISFYTFSSMSYTLDVYRGKLKPVQSFKDLFFYLSFFPNLVAGPIVRGDQFLYQMKRRRRLSLRVFNEAAWLLVRGYFLKMVCADNLAELVNFRWEMGYDGRWSGAEMLGVLACFSIQIFCDFEGYSSIARGIAYLLGYRLPINFNHPYIADSFTNFWKRWHITLSEWLRDYIFIPTGLALTRGRFKGQSAKAGYCATLLTFGVCGLWHGASLTFVVWGLAHGVLLCLERWIGMHSQKAPALARFGWFFFVQISVLLTWILFRSDSLAHAWAYFIHMIRGFCFEQPLVTSQYLGYLLPPVAMHVYGWLVEQRYTRPLVLPVRAALAGLLLFLTLTFYMSSSEFIYFKF